MEHKKRKIEELNLLDDFLFFEAVSGEKGEWFCRFLIRAICQREVGDLQIQFQSTVQGVDTTCHGIRMDLYVDEKGKCLYDFEPDKYSELGKLAKRNRYYRALLDGKLLETGTDYEKLPDLWTVFILNRDPFHTGRMCYTIKNHIEEEEDIDYEDGAVTLFLNTKGTYGGSRELTELLKYMENSSFENAKTKELRTLHEYVDRIKHKKEVGVRYMKSWEIEKMLREQGWREGREAGEIEGKKEGKKEGRRVGRAEGKIEGELEGKRDSIRQLLEVLGTPSDEVLQKLSMESDMGVLNCWLKLAAKSGAIEEFEEKM